MNILPFTTRAAILSDILDGHSYATIGERRGVNLNSAMRHSVVMGDAMQSMHDRLVRDCAIESVEMHEHQTFLYKKQALVKPGDPPEWGDQYVFTAVDPASRFVLAWAIGKRTPETLSAFTRQLSLKVAGVPKITRVTTDASRAERDLIFSTERFNQGTYGYAKKFANLCSAVAISVTYYNFCCGRVSAAMKAGFAEHCWSVNELLMRAENKSQTDLDAARTTFKTAYVIVEGKTYEVPW